MNIKKLVQNQRGQTLVELALIIPIIVVMLMATLEFGRIFFTYLTVTHASREAARATVVSVQKDDTFVRNKVIQAASWISPSDLTVEVLPNYITSPQPSRTTGIPLTVTVKCPVTLYTPILSDIMSNPFIVKSQTTMRIE